MAFRIRNEAGISGRRDWTRFRNNRPALASVGFLLALLAFIVLWPSISAYRPDQISDTQFSPPTANHWFGTDVHGRDLLARVAAGARISLLVGSVGAGVSLVIGVLWGAIAGYVGGRLDHFLMRTVDILYALPSIVFVIVLLTALSGWLERDQALPAGAGSSGSAQALSPGPGLSSAALRQIQWCGLFVGLGAVSWLTMARIVRGQVLALRASPFVEASRALGASHTRILLRHVLPNTLGIILVYLALTVPGVVLYESFLSYLGLGIQPPDASLGSLIAEGAAQINPLRVYWWIITFPVATLALALLALNFLADGLRDALDPRG